jgi:RNA polymerase sigma factor (sigma-70 family)
MQTPRPLTKVVRFIRNLDNGRISDGNLLRRFADAGDQDAFAQLVRRHGALVLGVCRRILRHHQDAEDATQAAFVVLARKASAIHWDESVAGWLHEVAVRVALEARTRVARRRSRELDVKTLPDTPSPHSSETESLSELLDQELTALPDKYRGPLVLCYLEGYTRDEAAEQLGWKLSQVKSRLEKGRELLRVRLARRGLTLGAILASALLCDAAVASMPADLVSSTMALATGQTLAAPALDVASGVLKSMFLAKVQKTVAVLLAALSLSLGLGFLGQEVFSRPETSQEERLAKARNRDDKKADAAEVKPLLTMRHDAMVRGAVFTPDGKRLAICCFDGTCRLWDAHTGKEVFHWKAPGLNSAIAVSRDGKYVAAGNAEGELFVWNADSGKEEVVRMTRHGNIYALAYSPDGALLASANHDGTVSLWNARTGANVRHIDAHENRVWDVAFAPDGKTLASGGEDGTIVLWDPNTGKAIRKLEGHRNHVSALSFSRDGKKLASADMEDTLRKAPDPDGLMDTIRVWDVASGKQLLSLKTPLTHSVRFTPDGQRLISGDRAGTVHVWNADTGKSLTTLKGHSGPVMYVHIDAAGRRIASAGEQGALQIWSLDKPR